MACTTSSASTAAPPPRAHLHTDHEGSYRFWGLTPTPYPIPDEGPVGQLLKAVGRGPMRASHLHFKVSSPGRRTLVTHFFGARRRAARRRRRLRGQGIAGQGSIATPSTLISKPAMPDNGGEQ
jgi:hypothetical protein